MIIYRKLLYCTVIFFKIKQFKDKKKLFIKYSEFSIGIRLVLRARCGYEFNDHVAQAVNRIEKDCPECCPCC